MLPKSSFLFQYTIAKKEYNKSEEGKEPGRLPARLATFAGDEALRKAYEDLEMKVSERTADLVKMNETLEKEISQRTLAEREREKLIRELREALAKVKTLSGLLPICAACKKIRDDSGYWNRMEDYIRRHSEAEFTHGLCPDCAKRLYPEFHDQGSAPPAEK